MNRAESGMENGQNPTSIAVGDTGGARLVGNEPRSALLALTRQVEKNLPIAEAEMTANIRFAVKVRDDEGTEDETLEDGTVVRVPRVTHRDKLRAIEFLEAVRARGIDVAMYLDKAERDDGKPKGGTVNIANAEGITFIITPLPEGTNGSPAQRPA